MNSEKTAIKRKTPSAPMRKLASLGLIKGRALDYGGGYGLDALEYNMEWYDPHYNPVMPDGLFDTITCNYVLNTIADLSEIVCILRDIHARLAYEGKAYITVRNDKRALIGLTRIGTWQCHVIMRLPIVHSCSGYVTYKLEEGNFIISADTVETKTYD